MKHVEIFLFIDALGWKIAQEHRFLEKELPERRKLEMQFGYSCTAIPTLLSGEKPSVHGHLGLFRFDPGHSPFRRFARLAPLFKPDSFWNRGRIRHWLSKAVKFLYGFTGYFQLYRMPIDKLGMMDYGEKKNLFTEHGMAPLENLCDMLKRTGVPFHISDWHKSDAENLKAGAEEIRRGTRFLFLYTAGLDGLLHQHVRNPDAVTEKLRWYESQIRELLRVCRESGVDVRLTVVSDHGMTPLEKTVDVMSEIEKTGLRFGVDYGACYDSTLARFHWLKPGAKEKIESAMRKFSADGHFLSGEEQIRYGIQRDDHRFGDALFLMNPGVQIVPSDMCQIPLNGMHGYTPDDVDSAASLLSNRPLPEDVVTLAGVYRLMKRRAEELKENAE